MGTTLFMNLWYSIEQSMGLCDTPSKVSYTLLEHGYSLSTYDKPVYDQWFHHTVINSGPDQFIDFFLYEENIDLLNGLTLSISLP